MNDHHDPSGDDHQRPSSEHDVVIIGGGAAGLSAALVLARARRDVTVIDAGHPRNAPASHMHGFLGSDGLPPSQLLATGRAEVTGYGGRVITGTVTKVTAREVHSRQTPGFEVHLDDDTVVGGRRVLLTTGLVDRLPGVPGARERWGRDLLHCPYCHGYEVRDQPLGVLSGSVENLPEALAHVHLVSQWSADIVFFANGAVLTADQRRQLAARSILVVDEPVARLVVDDDSLVGVELADRRLVRRAAVFIRPIMEPNDILLAELGCRTADNGWVAVDGTGRTSVPGVWAAGNAVNPRAQVITAAGEGSAAAIAINNDLVEEDLALAMETFRLGLTS